LNPNKVENRVSTLEYPANNPIEDRLSYHSFKNIDGFCATVFDGHGGWQVAELASRKLHLYLDSNLSLKTELNENTVKEAITNAFLEVENEFLELAKAGYNSGFGKFSNVGACCLSAVVINNKLYVANLGDCRGILLKNSNSDKDNVLSWIKLNTNQSANSKKVQKMLRDKYPDEKDIVVCKRPPKGACYVKGR